MDDEVEGRGLGGGGATDLFWDIRGTVTQSGSSVGVYGFDGRFGFGTKPFCGGFMEDRAGWPLSNHHFLLSELAGGKPGSMGSYPTRSSSSVSSLMVLAIVVPTDDRRLSYMSRLRDSRIASSTMLTVHSKVAYTGR